MRKLEVPRRSVDEVEVIETRGPWRTKSGGELSVQFALPRAAALAFLDYGNEEFDTIEQESGTDVRGLRSYIVSGVGQGEAGGKEFHCARTEYVAALAGSALWRCVDYTGARREFVLDGSKAVIQPPGLLHTYEALEDGTSLQVVCNTLFIPEDPRTHDTYSEAMFYDLIDRQQ